MIIAIMQPYFLPYIGYWQLIHAVDTFVIYDDVNYINRGYINRNSILEQNKLHRITLELKGASQNKLINQIEVGNNAAKLIKTIKLNYNKTPYFEYAFPIIEEILTNPEKNLAKFLGNSIKLISNFLGMNKSLFILVG